MKYIYGPLKSRRLGNSLGLSLTPFKVCSFDCVYCQLGKTNKLTVSRKEYLPILDIIEEFKLWLKFNKDDASKLDYITISGSGEPTLNLKIGELILLLKQISNIPIAVITNGSLLADPSVRRQLLHADLIVPSLDAVTDEYFREIDRPVPGITPEQIILGLVELRKEFKGSIWLEIMLVKGLNDKREHILELKKAADKINPDKIQLNSPVRATAEVDILPLDKNELLWIKEIFGSKCEII